MYTMPCMWDHVLRQAYVFQCCASVQSIHMEDLAALTPGIRSTHLHLCMCNSICPCSYMCTCRWMTVSWQWSYNTKPNSSPGKTSQAQLKKALPSQTVQLAHLSEFLGSPLVKHDWTHCPPCLHEVEMEHGVSAFRGRGWAIHTG